MAQGEPLSNDPNAHLSITTVQQALSWYAAGIAQAPGAPFGRERAEELSLALFAGGPCSAELFDDLITFGRLMHRMAGRAGVPPCNIGDVLAAVATLPPSVDAHWEHDRTVDEATSDKLGFTATSKGIVDAQANNRETWRSHAERCRSFIERAADLPKAKGTVVVLGVGHAFDIPLATLARTYDRVILIDVDAEALGATADALLRTEALHARIETRVQDLTGINRTMVATLDELVKRSKDRETAQKRIEDYVRSYRPAPSPLLAPERRADLLISCCVASQLAWPQRTYALARLQELGAVTGDAERSWSRAWFEFELRVQQDHIRACTDTAPITVLISDMVSRLTAIDPSGLECPTGQRVFTMGVDSLLERIPQSARAEDHASWIWPRHRPGPSGQPGSWMEVEGLVLYDRLKTMA